jgi:AGZA family xanthine/uracil permease-like MFS transporter
LTAVFVAILFLLAIPFSPVIQMIGGGIETPEGTLIPSVAPALVVVGCLMLQPLARIAWDDWTEAFPAFLTLVIMPFTFSITEGIAFGFIAYAALKLVTRRTAELHPLVAVVALAFLLRQIFLT